ncbi:MAG: hypothetical protein ACK54H_09175, partial [Phycisphaerales bacterium]
MMKRPAWLSAFLFVTGIALAVLAIGPALWLLLIALQPAGSDMTSVTGAVTPILQGKATLENFKSAWTGGGLAG